ncbi:unnamed protein product [Soboliphyme baturini]|uniref:Cysteine-rich DPF motif domain-containing protein 1 n=1 Tax=Soboliphyme baturini TaxID=241478 RepID=A0A183J1H5_9BILA|nr:unnamed protein product [Soboliphyme baturini]
MTEENVFTCYLCNFSSNYDYFGREPPWLPQIRFNEDLFIRKDPFAEPGTRKVINFITLGAICPSCGKSVCADSVGELNVE